MEDRKGDEDVPATLVSQGEVCGGRTGRRVHEVAHKPGNGGVDCFLDGAC